MPIIKKFTQSKADDSTTIVNLVHWFIKEENIQKKDVVESLGVLGITFIYYKIKIDKVKNINNLIFIDKFYFFIL